MFTLSYASNRLKHFFRLPQNSSFFVIERLLRVLLVLAGFSIVPHEDQAWLEVSLQLKMACLLVALCASTIIGLARLLYSREARER